MKITTFWIIVLMMFVDVLNLQAKDQSNGTKWVIITNSQDTIPILTFGSISGNIFQLNNGVVDTSLDINTVDRIVHMRESHFWTGALIGAPIGALVGAAIGSSMGEGDLGTSMGALWGLCLGASGGFILGGMVGAAGGSDTEYDFAGMPGDRRVVKIKYVISYFNSLQGDE